MTAPVVDANLRLGALDPEGDQRYSNDAASSAPLESTNAIHAAGIPNGHASSNGEVSNFSDVDTVTHRLGIHCDFCFFCRGFYGPCFGLPVCGPCHAFLFPERVGEAECVEEAGPAGPEEKDDSGDSGNEEPTDFVGAATDRTRKRGGARGGAAVEGGAGASGGVGFRDGFVTCNDDDGVDGDYEDDDVVASGSSDRVHGVPFPHGSSTPPLPRLSIRQSSTSPIELPVNPSGLEPDGYGSSPSSGSSTYPRLLSQSAASVEDSRGSIITRTNDRLDVCGVGVNGNASGVAGTVGVVSNAGGGGQLSRPVRPGRFSRLSGANNGNPAHNLKSERLAEKLLQLTTTKDKELVPPRLVDSLPPEVLIAIFGFLDDLSLWTAMQVSSRWHHLIADEYPDDRWRVWLRIRWPLFEPLLRPRSWRVAYSRLVKSSPCLLCLEQMMLQNSAPIEENSWRHRRLRSELKALQSDPPEGIQATPLDRFYCHWQATITGPHGSPYEGGVFFLSMQIPPTYPMKPPVVRFLTKTFHPNISRHGDIGLDSIHHNWSLALTISKVLISIQSLLTDPFIETSMEPQISSLIRRDTEEYNRIARIWTWRYAMHDVMAVPDDTSFDGP